MLIFTIVKSTTTCLALKELRRKMTAHADTLSWGKTKKKKGFIEDEVFQTM